MSSRKRAAPGADPPIQPLPNPETFQPVLNYSYDSQPTEWMQADNANTTFVGNNGYSLQPSFNNGLFENFDPSAPYMDVPQLGTGNMMGETGQLVRRNPNQQLTTRGSQWQEENAAQSGGGNADSEDENELAQRALAAKSDAQARNRQIPPFIQKLSSFLDESKNTDLIRWSDDGRSFVVLDEEEFAKTLIPELFKHNNYASFVRQLNMYGFHKKVGLSDNSMKASENKRKTPSEYWNLYFRRGRPDLLYLIQKPKTVPTSKRKREDGRGEHSDDEKKPSLIQMGDTAVVGGGQNQELATIPKQELVGLKNELLTVQRQQKLISGVIGQIKRQNDQLYQRADAFQAMHDRHESSINAILTFLATFYNRSLEGNGPMNMAEMFKTALGGQPNQQSSGNIVEMPDIPNVDINAAMRNGSSMAQARRKQPLLLPAPDSEPAASYSTSVPSASSSRVAHPRTQTATPQPRRPPAPRVSSVEDTGYVDVPSPMTTIKSEAETPQTIGDTQDILSAINAANANSPASASNLDFSSALEQMQHTDGTSSLTPQQQRQMLSMLGAGPEDATGVLSRMGDASLPQQINQSHEHLEILERLQKEQDAKVAQLAERLGPLSPNGSVPGLLDAQTNGTPIPPPDFNFEDFFNDTGGSQFEHDPNMPQDPSYADLGIDNFGTGDGSNHFTLGGANEEDLANMESGGYFGSSSLRPDEHLSPHRRVESLTSRETTPGSAAHPTEDAGSGTGNSPRKRRRTGEL